MTTHTCDILRLQWKILHKYKSAEVRMPVFASVHKAPLTSNDFESISYQCLSMLQTLDLLSQLCFAQIREDRLGVPPYLLL
jgi:hypothetical protein